MTGGRNAFSESRSRARGVQTLSDVKELQAFPAVEHAGHEPGNHIAPRCEAAMNAKQTDVFDLFSEIYENAAQEEMSLQQYLLACCEDKSMYASAPERMVEAIGEPNLVEMKPGVPHQRAVA